MLLAIKMIVYFTHMVYNCSSRGLIMCISIRKIGLGDDIQAVYHQKKSENFEYSNLPASKLFYNLGILKKDNIRIVLGSDKSNKLTMFVHTESVSSSSINDIYVQYLEFFFKQQLMPMPESLKSVFSVDEDLRILNGAMNSKGEFVILATTKDTDDVSKTVWMAIVVSPPKMGYRIPERSRYSPTPRGNDDWSMDVWNMLGAAGTVAGLFSLF